MLMCLFCFQYTGLVGFIHGCGGIGDIELFVDALDEGGHGVGCYPEPICDFFFEKAFA